MSYGLIDLLGDTTCCALCGSTTTCWDQNEEYAERTMI